MSKDLFFLTSFLTYLHTLYSLTITNTNLYTDLFSTDASSFASEISSWGKSSSNSPYYSLCSSIPILGGHTIGGTFSRTYNSLPSHQIVFFSMKLYILDDWINGNSLTITIGSLTYTLNQIGRTTASSPFPSNICGNSAYKDLGIVYYRGMHVHNGNSLTVSFSQSVSGGPSVQSWGVRELSLKFSGTVGSGFDGACFITPTGFSSSNQCSCQDFTRFVSGSCQSCSAACVGCIVGSSNCFYCASGYFFNGGTCSSCPSNCATCSSSSTCTQCSTGNRLLSNGQCGTCPSPMLNTSTTCYSPCASGQYLYWDGTCASTCSSPLTSSQVGNDLICNYGCLDSQFLYWDGSCGTTCNSPLNNTLFKGKKFCNFPCSAPTSFLYSNKSCLSNCNTPFSQSPIKSKVICTDPCSSGLFFFQNSTCRTSCPSPYTNYTSGTINHCIAPCTTTQFFYGDSSCRSACPSPLVTTSDGYMKYCACDASTPYYFQNGTCKANCISPYQISSSGTIQYCNTTCGSPNYLYENSSCLASCPSPFEITSDGITSYCACNASFPYFNEDSKSCEASCPPGYLSSSQGDMLLCVPACTGYLLSNSTCSPDCSSPFSIRTVGSQKYCDFPCDLSEYLFYDGTCVSNCSGIHGSFSQGVEQYCNPICNQSEFISPNGSCFSSCSSPLITITNHGYQFCLTPCLDPNFPFVLRNGTCVATCNGPWYVNSNYQYPMCDTSCNTSEYKTPSGTCSSNCLSPYKTITSMYYNYCDSPCSGSTPYMNFDTKNCVEKCTAPYELDKASHNNMCIFMKGTPSTATAVAGSTATATSTTASIQGSVGSASGGGASAFGMVTLNRFLYYTRYLQINYPSNLRQYYIEANNTSYLSLGIAIPSDGIEFPPYRSIPPAFEGWGLNSSFIANYWQTFSTIVTAIIIGFIFWVILQICKYKKKLEWAFFFEKLMYIFRWNFALIVFCTGYDSIMLYASCEFRTYSFDSPISIISFIAAIICSSLVFVFLFLTRWLAWKQYKVKHIKRIVSSTGNLDSIKNLDDHNEIDTVRIFMRNWQGFQILFTGYKDNTAFARGFIFFFMGRNILWILTLAILYQYPLAQIIIMCCLSYSMLLMMLIKRPFVNLVSKFEIPTFEFINAYVNTNILILAIMDRMGIEDPDLRSRIGSAIIFGFTFFGIVAFVGMGAYAILGIYSGVKKYRKMKAAGSLTFISLFTIPFVSYGMDFDEFQTNIKDEGRLSIARDPRTKEFSIVRKASFRPVIKLARREMKTLTMGSSTGTPTNRSLNIEHSSKDAFIKHLTAKGLQSRRMRSSQIAPMPLDMRKVGSDTETAEMISHRTEQNTETIELPDSPKYSSDRNMHRIIDINSIQRRVPMRSTPNIELQNVHEQKTSDPLKTEQDELISNRYGNINIIPDDTPVEGDLHLPKLNDSWNSSKANSPAARSPHLSIYQGVSPKFELDLLPLSGFATPRDTRDTITMTSPKSHIGEVTLGSKFRGPIKIREQQLFVETNTLTPKRVATPITHVKTSSELEGLMDLKFDKSSFAMDKQVNIETLDSLTSDPNHVNSMKEEL